jgi:hypothetical protein
VFLGVACGESGSLEVYDGFYDCHVLVLGTVSTFREWDEVCCGVVQHSLYAAKSFMILSVFSLDVLSPVTRCGRYSWTRISISLITPAIVIASLSRPARRSVCATRLNILLTYV